MLIGTSYSTIGEVIINVICITVMFLLIKILARKKIVLKVILWSVFIIAVAMFTYGFFKPLYDYDVTVVNIFIVSGLMVFFLTGALIHHRRVKWKAIFFTVFLVPTLLISGVLAYFLIPSLVWYLFFGKLDEKTIEQVCNFIVEKEYRACLEKPLIIGYTEKETWWETLEDVDMVWLCKGDSLKKGTIDDWKIMYEKEQKAWYTLAPPSYAYFVVFSAKPFLGKISSLVKVYVHMYNGPLSGHGIRYIVMLRKDKWHVLKEKWTWIS